MRRIGPSVLSIAALASLACSAPLAPDATPDAQDALVRTDASAQDAQDAREFDAVIADASALDDSAADASTIDDASMDQSAPLMDAIADSTPDARLDARADASADAASPPCTSSAQCAPAAACQQVACVGGRCVSSAQSCAVAPARTLAAACPAGTMQFTVSLGGACGGRCMGSTCSFATQMAPCVSATSVPQMEMFFADEAFVWNWIAARTAADYTLARPSTALTLTVPTNEDELFALWARLGPPGSTVADFVELDGLLIPPADFTDARMRRTAGTMTAYLRHFDMLADWATWNVAGNPYFNDPAVLRRAFTTAFIALVRNEGGSFGGATDTPNNFSMITRGFWLLRGVAVAEALASSSVGTTAVPACVQAAYHQLLARYFDRLASGPIQRSESNTDMYMPIIAALYRTARVLNDEARVLRARDRARELIQTSGLFHSAGYFHHGYDEMGFDASYEGITRFFFAHAAMETNDRPDFDLLRATHAQMVDLRQYTSFPDPGHNGTLVGPSHFSPATSAPSPRDQWADLPRMITQAALDSDAIYGVTRSGGWTFPTAANLRADVMRRVTDVNAQLTSTRAVTLSSLSATDHFHTAPNYVVRYDLRGLFARLRAAVSTAQERVPAERDTMATVRLGDDFTFVRRPTFASLVHWGNVSIGHDTSAVAPASCNVMGAMGCASTVRVGADGFGGGALSVFYAPNAGPLVMGMGHGMQNGNEDRNAWGEGLPRRFRPDATDPASTDAWWKWPSHALAGRTAAGRPFSSARVTRPMVTRSADELTVTVNGTISCAAGAVGCSSDPTAALNGALTYTRVFTAQNDALRVSTTYRYSRTDTPIDQLVESLPVNLGQFTGTGATVTLRSPVTVQWVVGASMVAASTTFTNNVSAVILQRGSNGVRIEFTAPQRVRLTAALSPLDASSLWLNTYQWNAAATNIQIDLRGTATNLPSTGSVTYALRAF